MQEKAETKRPQVGARAGGRPRPGGMEGDSVSGRQGVALGKSSRKQNCRAEGQEGGREAFHRNKN